LEEISLLVTKATEARTANAEKRETFGEIVRRFQDLAFGCAYAVLGDFHLAEDAAQEAFITAWRNLDQLRKPEAFPGWFRRIVLTQCNRMTRGKRLDTTALQMVGDVFAGEADPLAAYEAKERRTEVLAAIRELPEHERMVTTLFYIGDYSQNEIATFLEAPLTTVKKRLFSAREKLRERMLEMVRETLQERRPSRNEQFAGTVVLFNEALESFVAKVKQDRYVIAALLYGSLSHDTVWRKSDIDIILVVRDEKPGALRAHGLSLVEHGVNIHAELIPRSKFKQALEGALGGSFMHSSFALSTLLFTTDDTIRAYYDNVRTIGARDRQMRLMGAGSFALITLAKAEKWLVTRKDCAYSFLWIMYTIQHLASIEVLLNGELTSREVIPQALKLNPAFFGKVYADLIDRPKDEATIQEALDLINRYLDEKVYVLFGPVLEYLSEEGGIRTMTDLDEYFRKQVQTECWIGGICEWLADKGIIQKVPSPIRLTQKSQVTVDEAAFYYDGESHQPSAISFQPSIVDAQ
jgi:RNA polymerase sigma factor (sigma-70 family)